MKAAGALYAAVLAATTFLLIPACASRQAPDAGAMQAEVAAARKQEMDLVRSTVADPDRAARVIRLLEQRDRTLSEHAAKILEHRHKIRQLNADYHARREAFDTVLASYRQERAAAQKATLGLIAAMKRETTANEWKSIADFQLRKLDPRQAAYGRASLGD